MHLLLSLIASLATAAPEPSTEAQPEGAVATQEAPTQVPLLDAEGSPVLDEEGKPVMVDAPPPAPLIPGTVTPDSPHWDLEEYYAAGTYEPGLAMVNARLTSAPDDVVLHWMKIRFMYELGELNLDRPRDEKLAWYKEMVDTAEHGLELAPDDPHLHFAYSVALGRYGTTKGILSVMSSISTVEASLLKSIPDGWAYRTVGGAEHLPCHSYMALGVFYRLVPDSWIVSVLTGARGDMRKSVQWLEKAATCQPEAVQITKELAASRICLGQQTNQQAIVDVGMAELRAIPGFEDIMHTDHIDRKHAQMLLEKPEMACSYSRDGQQEHDMDALEKARKEAG